MDRKSYDDHKPYSRYTQSHPSTDRSHDPRSNIAAGRAQGGGSFRYYQESSERQTQVQGQLQRPVEASKQMLYGTFGNLIAILEEFEQRELKEKGMQSSLRRSNIPIPYQGKKRYDDVKSNVETQLLLFETQSKACPPEVRAALLEELKRKTLSWAAVREEMRLPDNQDTDRYISKLYEILAKGKTDHKVPSRQGLTEHVMRDSFQAIIYGDHDRKMLDQAFRGDPNKQATAPHTRHSEMFDEAARRISRARGSSDLDANLQEDVRRMREYGPSDLK
ncbi:uncharacterized protein LOC128553506 [Mercenaria mercenaria]|uniref:uncharacterized protein LOC128553506 n=1 Tax=Mercenaria mercenaria TaxID=6596 RepID=UPI00234E432B|nr:uncharacterized protein LOC128553506 [Mercenaria mercenaria]